VQVRDAFALAKEKQPAIIFIDEIDAIGTKRFDSELSGDREVQRTMLELLNQLDGFTSNDNVKVGTDNCPCRNMRVFGGGRDLWRGLAGYVSCCPMALQLVATSYLLVFAVQHTIVRGNAWAVESRGCSGLVLLP
jgi:SpoVK/Ycf46/Vps4 family AAA+-type ATPase